LKVVGKETVVAKGIGVKASANIIWWRCVTTGADINIKDLQEHIKFYRFFIIFKPWKASAWNHVCKPTENIDVNSIS